MTRWWFHFFYFHLGEDFQFGQYFSDALVQPSTRWSKKWWIPIRSMGRTVCLPTFNHSVQYFLSWHPQIAPKFGYIYLHEWLICMVNVGILIYIYIPVPWILWELLLQPLRGFSPVSGASLKSQRRSGGGVHHRKTHGGRDWKCLKMVGKLGLWS